MSKNRHFEVKISPIAHTSSLASILGLKEKEMFCIAENVTDYYKPGKILRKKNGEPRHTHDAKPELKNIHTHIKNRILKKAVYPYYMMGGISDPINPRSCKSHAKLHTKKKIMISEDIENFFPRTTSETVKKIWKYLFNFSEEVSVVLTKLTTFKGELPQGWRTSTYIANLALFSKEQELVKMLEEKGMSYSRFIDDVTVSSPFFLNSKNKQGVISNVYGMLYSSGYNPKRTKHEIRTQNMQMSVTSLGVNAKEPTLTKDFRKNVRAMVHQLEQDFPKLGNTLQFNTRWQSVNGSVNRVKTYHKKEGSKLQERMKRIKPLIDVSSKKKKLA